MSDTLNLHEWQDALDIERSFVIDGGAGTGKSELAFQRYLRLLAQADQPEEVLFLIDGKRRLHRVRRRLAAIVQSENSVGLHEDELRARNSELSWNLAEQPDRLQVHTLGSLAAAIVASAPVASGCGAAVRLTDDPEGYYRIAARALLRTLDHDERVAPKLETLLLHLDNDLLRTERLLAGMLRRRVELQHCLKLDEPDNSRSVLQAALEDAVAMTLTEISSSIPGDIVDELASVLSEAAREIAVRDIDSPIRAWRDLATLPAADAAHLEPWRGLCDAFLDEQGRLRQEYEEVPGFAADADADSEAIAASNALRQRMTSLAETLGQQPGLLRRIAALRHVSEVRYTHLQWTVLQSLLAVLPRVMEDLNSAFRALGEVDLPALLQGATRAVASEQTEIFSSAGLQHIVIDDFHEMSYAAIDLIENLIRNWREDDGRTVFATGNPFASVRRDAGAQPALYLKLHHSGLGQRKLNGLRLPTVFSSSQAVQTWLNNTFGALRDGVLGEGAMPYWPASTPSESAGEVSLEVVDGDIESEAAHVAELVVNARPAADNTVAVLLADESDSRFYLDALRARNVRCYSEESEKLGERTIIRDLHALTRALLHLADRVAWLSILRAPWCGLTLADLHRLVGDSSGVTVWELIIDENRRARLSEDGQQRLSRIKRVLAQSLAERGRRDLRRLIEGVWTALGGAVCVRDYHELQHTRDYFELLSEIDDGGEPDSLEALDAAVDRLVASVRPDPDAVIVTTIRRARRREYDTVILAGLQQPIARPEQDDALRWLVRPGQFGDAQLLMAPVHPEGGHDAIDLWLASLQNAQHDNELKRLFYVGANRARERLHLVAALPCPDGQWVRPPRHSLLDSAWSVIHDQLPEQPLRIETVQQVANRQMRRLPSSWLLPEAPQAKVWNVMRTADSRNHARFDGLDNDDSVAAQVMVRMLQEIAGIGPTEWALRSLDGLENNLQRLLAMMGMTENAIGPATDRSVAAIRSMLENDRGRWLLEPREQARTPLRISGWLDDELHDIEVDRSFVDGQGVRWLIRFGFADLPAEAGESTIDEVLEKMREEMKLQSRLVNRLDAAVLRVGLFFPFSSAWHDWDPQV